MNLMPQSIRKSLPALYSTEHKKPEEVPVVVKYFNPVGAGTWYVTEFDGIDTMFGLCVIHEAEMGYVNLSELQSLRLPFGMGIERDLHWSGTLADAMRKEGR